MSIKLNQRFVTTQWGAFLNLYRIDKDNAWISDPEAIDAGMFIPPDEIVAIWKVKNLKSAKL